MAQLQTDKALLARQRVRRSRRARADLADTGGLGDYAEHEPDSTSNLFDKTETATKLPAPEDVPVARYVINHDKQTYADKTTVVANAIGAAIHPLPVLTAEGNGRGGGDLREGSITGHTTLVGTWARDRITVADIVPDGYQALEVDLIEPW
ncbi:hypothetical protein ABZV58_29175 [Nocardia sp. NPDC004654]|uniref:hypothetical protein n=1 Tax=Nocardia sp. NPDC004654 TaxID=3154776 RepID=UPI0033BEE721